LAYPTEHAGREEFDGGAGSNDRVVLFEEVEDDDRRAWSANLANIAGHLHGNERD
jgi:hypothetical protein